MTRPPKPATSAADDTPARLAFAWTALLLLLFTLALRLTFTESLQEPLVDRMQALFPNPDLPPVPPSPGPTATVFFTAVACLAAAIAAWYGRITRTALLRLALIAGILGLGVFSAARAANAYAALVGLCDLATALLAGWAVGQLATTPRRRLFIVAILLALLAVWSAKGLMQYFDENPATRQYYEQNKEQIWMSRGWQAGDADVRLYEARLRSNEIMGFVTHANLASSGAVALLLAALGFLLAHIKPMLSSIHTSGEIPTAFITGVATAILILIALPVVLLSKSSGAIGAMTLFATLLIAGYLVRSWLAAHWRPLTLAAIALAALAGVGVLVYGIFTGGLPSLSLLYRWHYWTGAWALITDHPALGVGLHNFGSYYPAVKLPHSPEDVKDPHSFFVRFAAELGLPAAALVAALVVWSFYRAARPTPQTDATPANGQLPLTAMFALGGTFITVWFIVRTLMADIPDPVFFVFAAVYAAIAFAGYATAAAAGTFLTAAHLRIAAMGLLAGAAAMFLYDQINMALVTGPLAMLFWIMLGTAGASTTPAPAASKPLRTTALAAGSALFLLTLLVAGAAFTTLAPSSTLNAQTHELQAVLLFHQRRHTDALAAIDAAIARDPRSLSLRRTRIQILHAQGRPVADDVQQLLALAPADQRTFEAYGMSPAHLPTDQRIAALRRALELDNQWPPAEPRRFTPERRKTIEQTLTQLESSAPTTRP